MLLNEIQNCIPHHEKYTVITVVVVCLSSVIKGNF